MFLASGGDFGKGMFTRGGAEVQIPGQGWLQHYNASTCKNTAHKFALHRFLTQTSSAAECSWPGTRAILCNLDCNIIVFPSFTQAALEAMAAKAQQFGIFAIVPPSSCHQSSSCTGHQLYFLEDFATSGGYDQEPGSYLTGHPTAESFEQVRLHRWCCFPWPTSFVLFTYCTLIGYVLQVGHIPNSIPVCWHML